MNITEVKIQWREKTGMYVLFGRADGKTVNIAASYDYDALGRITHARRWPVVKTWSKS